MDAADGADALYTWGRNGNGQLGHGGKADATEPKVVTMPQKLRKIRCAHFHSVALSADGAVYTWGRGALGLLGHGDENDYEQPRPINKLTDEPVEDVGCGPYHTALVTKDGKIMAWGWALVKEDGAIEESFNVSPVLVPPLAPTKRVVGIACGCYASAVWTEDGRLLTWGRGGSGQLGHGGLEDEVAPREVAALGSVHVVQAALGGMQELGFMIALGADGAMHSCGAKERGRLGRTAPAPAVSGQPAVGVGAPHHTPGPITLFDPPSESGPNASFVVDIAAADHHAAAVTHGGGLYTWGANDFARLGVKEAGEVAQPTRVATLAHVRVCGVACAAYSTLVTVGNGTVFTMGGRPGGAATPEAMAMPTPLELPEGASAVAAGGYHMAALVGGRVKSKHASPNAGAAGEAGPAPGELPASLEGLVSADLAELLLADCRGAPSLQLRHELHLLRELLAAEQRKLDGLQPAEPPPAATGGVAMDDRGLAQPTMNGVH